VCLLQTHRSVNLNRFINERIGVSFTGKKGIYYNHINENAKTTLSERMSSFLMAHQHNVGYTAPC